MVALSTRAAIRTILEDAMADTHVLAKGVQDYPPLPEVLVETSRRTPAGKAVLADGCYFISYGLLGIDTPNHMGTLRVDSQSGRLSVSADFYTTDSMGTRPENNPQPVGSMPPPAPGIPIFPIKDYRLYLRITKIEAAETGFALAFEAHRFIAATYITLDAGTSSQWAFEGTFTAQMVPAAPPPGYPSPEFFFVGDVSRVATGVDTTPVGRMQIGWVSSALRRAVVEIDRVPDSKVPQDNGAGLSWQSMFQLFGWEMRSIVSDDNVTKSSDSAWTPADAEAVRQKHRDSSDLDTEWRYYLLVASQIIHAGSNFGFMYHPAREALYMASQFVFPQTEVQWGALRGARFDTTVAFFRTAVHEMGHAMGLGHNPDGLHIMRPTDAIAQEASADKPFPANIEWSFDSNDEQRLRHWPDIVVRPGGAAIGVGGALLPEQA
jgi:predicted Zn-dependent protease